MKQISIIIFLFLIGCQMPSQQKQGKTTSSIQKTAIFSCQLPQKAKGNYTDAKNDVITVRERLFKQYKSIKSSKKRNQFLDSTSKVFAKQLLHRIAPFWYGTTWDFNGYTAKPNEGVIACGYFVSTTLRDMGIKINRYKMAQQAAANEIYSLTENRKDRAILNPDNYASLEKMLQQLSSGLYVVGLDYHVGYLWINNNQYCFVHSSYVDGKVLSENALTSKAFVSRTYYFGKLTGNRSLMKKWLTNTRISIVTK